MRLNPSIRSGLVAWILTFASLFVPTRAQSALITADGKVVTIHGTIQIGDEDVFAAAIKRSPAAIVELNSGGGSVDAALEIGRHIRKLRLATTVLPGTPCASACALVWLAGVARYADDSSFIGFHAAYIYRHGVPVESGAANALVGAYLNELGLPTSAVRFVTSAPPQGIARLERTIATRLGITYTSMRDAPSRQVAQPAPPTSPAVVVEAFYKALAAADGASASSLVVPAKRGYGPFNEQNISSFYRNMAEPLTVDAVEQTGTDTFTVKYRYRVTRSECNGIAQVRTQTFMGSTLIERIHANC